MIITRMQLLKAKLSDVKIFAAMFSIHEDNEEPPSEELVFLLMFLLSYNTKQTAALTITSTGRFRSLSTTCTPSFSIARILWYVVLLDIIIPVSAFWVFTMMMASGNAGVFLLTFFGSITEASCGACICVALEEFIILISSTGVECNDPSEFLLLSFSIEVE